MGPSQGTHIYPVPRNCVEAEWEGCVARNCPLPSPLGWSIRSAAFLFLSRTLRILSCPSLAARCRTELPQRSRRLRSAPTLSKSSTTSSCLVMTAKCKGVWVEKGQESRWLLVDMCSRWLQSRHCSMAVGHLSLPDELLTFVRSFLFHRAGAKAQGGRRHATVRSMG